MPTFINPFQGTDPTAQAISDFGNAVFGNTGAGALRKEQILKAQRENAETGNFGALIQKLGAAAALADNTGQAELFASGYAPKDAADLALAGNANAYGATDQRTQNSQIGAGQSYDNTAAAVQERQAEVAREFNQKPVATLGPSGPVYTPQGDANGQTPVLSDSDEKGVRIAQNWDKLGDPNGGLTDEQLRVLGAAPKGAGTGHNYLAPDGTSGITLDDTTDSQTHQPLPQGTHLVANPGANDPGDMTNANKTALGSSVVQASQFHGLAQAMIGLTDAHPEAFGLYGKVAGGVQGIMQSADTLITQMGGKQAFDGLLTNAQQTLAQNGASPDILAKFNPAIPAVDTLGPVLAYSAASAVANQTGRSVSDKEIEMWSKIVGDPQGWLSSATEVKTRMEILDATVSYAEKINKDFLAKGIQPDPTNVFTQAYTQAINDISNQGDQPVVAPGGPTPSPAPDQSGAPVEIKDDAGYAALPSGAMFKAPDGTIRKKP